VIHLLPGVTSTLFLHRAEGKNFMNIDIDKLQYHELANEFPLLDEEELKELAADIEANGLLEPIVLYGGKVLDGRNRYNACKKAGYKFGPEDVVLFEERYPDEDPVLYVLSKNIYRRHLGVGQRAAVAQRFRALMGKRKPGPKESRIAEIIPPVGERTKKVAAAAGVSVASVERAAYVQKHDPEGFKELQKGTKTLREAHRETQKRISGAEIDAAWQRVKDVCGKSFAAAIAEDQIPSLGVPKNLIAFAGLADDKMKTLAPALRLGWKLERALLCLDKEITPATTLAQGIDLFAFRGSKRMEFELEEVHWLMTKAKQETVAA
jgi:hypothetical protein